MKIVINRCYGGFSLSPRAVQRMAEIQGKPCYFFTCDVSTGIHTPAEIEKISGLFWQAFSVPNPDEVLGYQKRDWHEMSDEEKVASNQRYESIRLEQRDQNRADPLLIQVVEELKEVANGRCADLKIVEIPDGVEWEIDEYDGMEHVAEKHRTWC